MCREWDPKANDDSRHTPIERHHRADESGYIRASQMYETTSRATRQILDESCELVAYLINRGPSTIMKTHALPEEAWTNKEISLAHLWIFGCTAYMGESSQGRSLIQS